MIMEALKWLKENLNPAQDTVSIDDKVFLRNPNEWREVGPNVGIIRAFRNELNGPTTLGTVDSLIDFVKARDIPCQVVVGTKGCSAYFNVDESVSQNLHMDSLLYVKVPFIARPAVLSFRFVAFQDFLDQHRERIHEHDQLARAVREFKGTESHELKVKEVGPIIKFQTTAKKDIEGSSYDIPKEITIDMPTGTREFLIPNLFLLRITPGDKDISFTLTKKEQDGSWETLIELAFAKLREGLPGALILEGP